MKKNNFLKQNRNLSSKLIALTCMASFFLAFSACNNIIVDDDTGIQSEGNSPHDWVKDFPFVETEYMGEKIWCRYVDGLYIIQGDIIIKDDNDTTAQNDMMPRAARPVGVHELWEKGKVYYHLPIPPDIFSDVIMAMTTIENATNRNIKFIPLYTLEAQYYGYLKGGAIKFVANPNLSNSYVGRRTVSYSQPVNIIPGSYHALHEICHALGLMHEHSRPDRDQHVEIDTANIDPKYRSSDGKYHDFDNWGTIYSIQINPYSDFDIGSVMMYAHNAGSRNGQSTIIWKKGSNPYPPPPIFQLSDGDINVINQMYPYRPVVEPDVVTYSYRITTSNSCELGGELIYAGVPAITEYGFLYREINTTDYKFQSATDMVDVLGVYTYTCELTNLKPDTRYEAVACVWQNGQAIYGDYAANWIRFRTEPEEDDDSEGVLINGVEWATCNVGASSPEGYGGYYTLPEAQEVCPSGWRLPTPDELESLTHNAPSQWTDNGRIFGSDKNTIFLPAAGMYYPEEYSYQGIGVMGFYWSSGSLYNGYHVFSMTFDIISEFSIITEPNWGYKRSCRCVKDKK